jgi:hypothetical protein
MGGLPPLGGLPPSMGGLPPSMGGLPPLGGLPLAHWTPSPDGWSPPARTDLTPEGLGHSGANRALRFSSGQRLAARSDSTSLPT